MSETRFSTGNITKIAENTAPFLTTGFLDENSGYPYAIPEETLISGLSIQNSSGTTALTLDVTLSNAQEFSIPVNAGGTYTGYFESIIIEVDCTGSDFAIELLKRSS